MSRDGGFATHWRRAAGDLAVLLLFGHLLLATLFYWPSWRRVQTVKEVLCELALLVGIYSLVSMLMAIPVAAIAAALHRQRAAASARFAATYTHVCVLFMLVLLSPFATAWLRTTVKVVPARNFQDWFVAACAGFWLLFAVFRGWVGAAEAMSRRLRSGDVAAAALTVIATLVLALTGHASLRPFGWASGPSPAAATSRPDVYLITIDTLAAQDMSLYGYHLPTTPQLERFAERAHVFEDYQASANWTQPTIATIMTGLYPDRHRCNPNNARLDPSMAARTLPALMRQAGYTTAAITSNTVAHPLARGFGSAFDYLSEPLNEELWQPLQHVMMLQRSHLIGPAEYWWFKPFEGLIKLFVPAEQRRRNPYPAEPLIERTLRVTGARSGPRFVWTHFFAPHAPYLPPEPFRGRFLPGDEFRDGEDLPSSFYDVRTEQPRIDRLRLRYDEFVAYADRAVGQLIDELARTGALDRSIVIVTADHGESFSHGWVTHHGPVMNQAVLHVPLLVHLPGQATGTRIQTGAEEVDLLPTILDLADVPVPGWAEGRSFAPALEAGTAMPERARFSYELTTGSRFTDPETGAFAVVLGDHKLVHRIRSGCEDLFDLRADPQEKLNLASQQPEKLLELRRLIQGRQPMPLRATIPPDGKSCKLAFPEAF